MPYCKPAAPKPEKLWAVYGFDGYRVGAGPRFFFTRREALDFICAALHEPVWETLRSQGYRCIRVRITPEETF